MKKTLGMFLLLVTLIVIVGVINPRFFLAYNLQNTVRQISMLSIFSIGVGLVIITGGIDLSVGSLIGLTGIITVVLLTGGVPVIPAVLLVLLLTAGIGSIHGFLVAKLRIQPFIVTLCGLMIYRGLARFMVSDMTQGFGTGYEGLKYLAMGLPLGIPFPFIILLFVAGGVGVFLHLSVHGRHIYALGLNEQTAVYSGISVDRLKIVAYVLSALLAGVSGLLYSLYTNTVQPAATGNSYELYAIASAVLGGCSLRGGEGTVVGIIIGASILRMLMNGINLLGISSYLETAIIGVVILAGVLADELMKRRK